MTLHLRNTLSVSDAPARRHGSSALGRRIAVATSWVCETPRSEDFVAAVLEHSQFNGVRTLGERFITRLSDVVNPETGECDSLSVAARVHGVPAFVFTESRLSDAGSAP